MTDPKTSFDGLFAAEAARAQRSSEAGPASRSKPAATRTPAEVRAAETTRVAREMTDAITERRHAQVARLREARLEKEAEAKAAAALEPPVKKKARKKG